MSVSMQEVVLVTGLFPSVGWWLGVMINCADTLLRAM